MYFIGNGWDYMYVWTTYRVYSRHFTFIFNTFVMLQVFNFLNSRKLHDELNIFAGLLSNTLFIIIVFAIVILQILLVTFGSLAFGVYSYYGLTIQQWLISIAFGSGSLLINFLTKFIPENKIICCQMGNKMEDPLSKKKSGITSLKRETSSFNRNLSYNNQL